MEGTYWTLTISFSPDWGIGERLNLAVLVAGPGRGEAEIIQASPTSRLEAAFGRESAELAGSALSAVSQTLAELRRGFPDRPGTTLCDHLLAAIPDKGTAMTFGPRRLLEVDSFDEARDSALFSSTSFRQPAPNPPAAMASAREDRTAYDPDQTPTQEQTQKGQDS